MRSKSRYAKDMLAAAAILLSLAYLQSCAAGRRVGGAAGTGAGGEKADSAEFVPLHPPIVVPHTWRETMKEK